MLSGYHLGVPSFVTAGMLATPAVRAALVRCDGRDAARPESEAVDGERLWIILAGRLSWRDRQRRVVGDEVTRCGQLAEHSDARVHGLLLSPRTAARR